VFLGALFGKLSEDYDLLSPPIYHSKLEMGLKLIFGMRFG